MKNISLSDNNCHTLFEFCSKAEMSKIARDAAAALEYHSYLLTYT